MEIAPGPDAEVLRNHFENRDLYRGLDFYCERDRLIPPPVIGLKDIRCLLAGFGEIQVTDGQREHVFPFGCIGRDLGRNHHSRCLLAGQITDILRIRFYQNGGIPRREADSDHLRSRGNILTIYGSMHHEFVDIQAAVLHNNGNDRILTRSELVCARNCCRHLRPFAQVGGHPHRRYTAAQY